MSKFITGKELIDTIDSIIWDAEKTLLIVSPFIKLDGPFKKNFKKHINNPALKLVVVFGKNENAVQKSLNKEDFEFFKSFKNVSVIYEPKLHAKYYGNEKKGVITSINLYDHSVENNIEFGVFSEQTLLTQLSGSNHDLDAWQKCIEIANNGKVVYIKRPVYEQKKFIINYSKVYIDSEVLVDDTDYFYEKKKTTFSDRKLGSFPEEIDSESVRPVRDERPIREERKVAEPSVQYKSVNNYQAQPSKGYCIRTGEQIPFNPNQPLSYSAWKIWNEFGNVDFPEKFCHLTGRPSNGKTSFRKPILG
ncbi:hypothetical protein AM493_12670 [Flavobacterium akiainvivens]|uniref:Phospholipase D-like domain-containing protein n=1 Tax=Flavobacterium akiainvivens TaxID=1202724 RepID=A0A0M8MI94_9FLAO|nr:phospholipase D family protein [Flavobacterium akiainvivens]KOS06781.1 hypothetical protein AM493_12670 [Flavobacterium akiainvivens]SFQ77183.1 hypothetical protein SAMN05444144_12526 [Flavobacterium akiainvivens]